MGCALHQPEVGATGSLSGLGRVEPDALDYKALGCPMSTSGVQGEWDFDLEVDPQEAMMDLLARLGQLPVDIWCTEAGTQGATDPQAGPVTAVTDPASAPSGRCTGTDMPVPSAFAGFGGGVLVGMRPASVHLGHTTPPGSLSMSKDSGYCMQLGARAGDTGGDGGSEAALQAALLSLAMPGPLALQLQLQLQLEVQMHADVDTLQSSDWSGVGPYEDQDPDCPYDYDLFSPGGEGGDTFQDHGGLSQLSRLGGLSQSWC